MFPWVPFCVLSETTSPLVDGQKRVQTARSLWDDSRPWSETSTETPHSPQGLSQLMQHFRKVSYGQQGCACKANRLIAMSQIYSLERMRTCPREPRSRFYAHKDAVWRAVIKSRFCCMLWLIPALEHEPQTQSRRKQNKT